MSNDASMWQPGMPESYKDMEGGLRHAAMRLRLAATTKAHSLTQLRDLVLDELRSVAQAIDEVEARNRQRRLSLIEPEQALGETFEALLCDNARVRPERERDAGLEREL